MMMLLHMNKKNTTHFPHLPLLLIAIALKEYWFHLF